MGLFSKSYIRSLPYPPVNPNNAPSTSILCRLKLFVTVLVFLYFGTLGASSIPWNHVQTENQVENIISDYRNGSVYLVQNSDIYAFNIELKLLSSTETSTSNKVINSTRNNFITNRLLTLIKNNNQDFLLSCWHTKEFVFRCWLNKLSDVRSGSILAWSDEIELRINPSDHVIGSSGISNGDDIIIITSRSKSPSSNTSELSYMPTISRFAIVKTTKNGIKQLALAKKSKLQLNPNAFNSRNLHDYIYLFSYDQYTYFILNDIHGQTDKSSGDESNQFVRLARICRNDTDFTSYTEIILTCNDQNNLIAKTATLDFNRTDPLLFIVYEFFEESDLAGGKTPEKSLICSYSIKFIDAIFFKAISDCNSGSLNSILLTKYHAETSGSVPCQSNPSSSNDWCTSKTNQFIDGTSSKIVQDNHWNLDGINGVNFLYATRQGPNLEDVFFIGSDYGQLTKMSLNEDLLFTIDFNRFEVKDYHPGEKLKSKTKLSSNRTTQEMLTKYSAGGSLIYAISNGSTTLSQIDINACNYYRSCQSCLLTRDPLECVWCGNTCAPKSKCEPMLQSTNSCPPVIRSFSPLKGLISGRTRIQIVGENFGSQGSNVEVKLNGRSCLIDKKFSTSDTVVCITEPVEKPINATISIDVSGGSGVIDSKGSSIAPDTFSYLIATVYGLYPQSGSRLSRNIIDVFGQNLDIGSRRAVLIGDSECSIQEHVPTRIKCFLEPTQNKPSVSEIDFVRNLKVLIDDTELKTDPKFQFEGRNLSLRFNLTSDPPVITEESISEPSSSPRPGVSKLFVFFIVLLVILLIVALLFMFQTNRISALKFKLPTFGSNHNKLGDAKVTFRNPQSHKFQQPNSNPQNESLGGLVKLNGSVMSSDYFGKPDQIEPEQPLMEKFLDNDLLTMLIEWKILIDRSRLTLGHVLGSGQFGRVYKGFLKLQGSGEHAVVAVKTLHNKSAWDDASNNRAFLEEGLMMKDFEHENVLALIGVTFDSNDLPMVITPFMLYGDLRSYISDEASSPTVKELIDFGTQVAKGMAYLSGLKFVHRDLAARNCMLDDNLVVKVADFGLSRDIYERDYYSSDNKKAKLPVKWMAIESLEKSIYNTKTDVWSYGILLWELMTRGVVPYPDVDNFDLFKYLKEGRRMSKPRYCPAILYNIMLSCWDENPSKRPSFEQLVKDVSNVITQLKIAKDEKVSRDETYCDVLK